MFLDKKIVKGFIALCVSLISFNVLAVDQVAKEDTTPPVENGPLTMEQIPPINN